ncbi:hypothetical protein CDAR_615961 [Caerostris darwini]|uniref:Uncharacterized protein n=1 Tax=Caerostris darwini TaxID=1538125 RepID=A0AAV4RZK7_9ARAC|nr:hypothetical protein CDAR_615961 [Caerostris darwini]
MDANSAHTLDRNQTVYESSGQPVPFLWSFLGEGKLRISLRTWLASGVPSSSRSVVDGQLLLNKTRPHSTVISCRVTILKVKS